MASISKDELSQYLEQLLNCSQFKDYGPNGLQVEGKTSISKIVTGVTSNLALIEKAIELNADAILVHHGLFWKGDSYCLTGSHGKRIKRLVQHDLNLFGYHLPLDAHPTLGNNAQLANLLGLKMKGFLDDGHSPSIGVYGEFENPEANGKGLLFEEFVRKVATVLNREPLCIKAGKTHVKTIAWCTGAAQKMINCAIDAGVDVYLSGEISEPTFHLAHENQIHYISAGHHATERYGIKALGEHLASKFNLEHHFIDIDNPV